MTQRLIVRTGCMFIGLAFALLARAHHVSPATAMPMFQNPNPVVPLNFIGDNSTDGTFGNSGDSLLNSTTTNSSGDFTVTSSTGWPSNGRGVIALVAYANAIAYSVSGSGPSSGTAETLWEDTDTNGVYGNSGDNVLDCDMADLSGHYDLATPSGWGGQGSKPTAAVYAVSSTAASISGNVHVTANWRFPARQSGARPYGAGE